MLLCYFVTYFIIVSKFIDQVKIYVKAGDGGRGCVSFRREKFVPRGGPDGGDGGRGGSIVLEGDSGLLTLLDFKYQPHLKAGRGGHGRGKDCNGRAGDDKTARVPLGTIVTDLATGKQLGEILSAGERLVVARGGRGGRGNKQFTTSTNQAPRRVEPGELGEEKNLQLELKIIADLGLVGAPNAGKSTLINYISTARSKTAGYPFTTLTPVLGVVDLADDRRLVVADLPGLIEGAYQGRGLGDLFLRHIERSQSLVFLLDMADKPVADYQMLINELSQYKQSLLKKTYLIAANKMDLAVSEKNLRQFVKEAKVSRKKIFPVSALTGSGIETLLSELRRLNEEKRAA